jgi:hypothetical protein
VGEERPDFLPGHLVQQLEQPLAFLAGRFLDQVRGIVGWEQTQPQPLLASGQGEQQRCLLTRLQAQEELVRLVARELLELTDPLLDGERGPLLPETNGVAGIGECLVHASSRACGRCAADVNARSARS